MPTTKEFIAAAERDGAIADGVSRALYAMTLSMVFMCKQV